MNYGVQRAGLISGLVFILFFFVGFCYTAGFTPAMSPTMTGEEVAAYFEANRGGIKLACILMMLGALLSVPWAIVIAVHMARIEGRYPVLAITQMLAGALDVLAFAIPMLFWSVAAFRPDRAPELMLMLNDLGWIGIVMMVSPATLQAAAIGLATLVYSQAQPDIPRWTGYVNMWFTFFFLGGCLVLFFKTGPFAWDGLIAYWLPLILFGLWWLFNTGVFWRVLRLDEARSLAAPAS